MRYNTGYTGKLVLKSWFNGTFDHETRRPFTDRRMVWYGLHLLGRMLDLSTMGGLIATTALTPALAFIMLVLPVVPVVLGLMTVIGTTIDRPWAYALGNALFFGWVITAVFPLA